MSQLQASANAAIGYMEHIVSPWKSSPSNQFQPTNSSQNPVYQTPASATSKKRKRQSVSKSAPSPAGDQIEPVLTAITSQPTEELQKTPKKRGRPPGSKNKPKEETLAETAPIHGTTQLLSLPTETPRKPGRPLGSKNKPKELYDHESLSVKKPRLHKESVARRKSMSDLTASARNVTLAGAVNTCMTFAMTVGATFARPSILPEANASTQIQNHPPQTPRKPRKSTGNSSPHFFDAASTPARRTPTVSAHFSPKKRTGVSVITFPSLKSQTFGLIQEELASNPFHVLIAVIFLAKTSGNAAIPVIRTFIEDYPTPESLAAARPEDLLADIAHLGLGSSRAQALVALAKAWVVTPPGKGKRYKRLNYPTKGAGKDILPRDEPLADEDPREAYEIAHLPGIGPYGLDSWRIFCRDALRQMPTGLQKGSLKDKEAAVATEMQQEWTKVMPADKELSAYLRWRWLRLGISWFPETGEKRNVDRKILKKMYQGRLSEHEGLQNPWTSA